MQKKDIDQLESIFAEQATSSPIGAREFLKDLVQRTNLPEKWKQEISDSWTGSTLSTSRRLIEWACAKGTFKDKTHPKEEEFTALGSILSEFMDGVGSDVQEKIANIIIRYRLYLGDCLQELADQYEIPIPDYKDKGEFQKGIPDLKEFLKQSWSAVPAFGVGLGVTITIVGARHLGIIESQELRVYDQFMVHRPGEEQDRNITIVKIDKEEIERSNLVKPNSEFKKTNRVSNETLLALLQKLAAYRPHIIGLDVFPYKTEKGDGYAELIKYLGESNTVLSTCQFDRESSDSKLGTIPPKDIPVEKLAFTNAPFDTDKFIRRSLLALGDDSLGFKCDAQISLSFELARRYLYEVKDLKTINSSNGYIQIGDISIKDLGIRAGAYQPREGIGYQILLNYRSPQEKVTPFQEINANRILDDKADTYRSDIEGKVVLIGYTSPDPSINDDLQFTPYSAIDARAHLMPGVVIHAHMVSQILNAALNKRALMQIPPTAIEWLWIFIWSCIAGGCAWFLKAHKLVIVEIVGFVGLWVISFVVFWKVGLWLPVVPATWAFVGTSLIVVPWTWKRV